PPGSLDHLDATRLEQTPQTTDHSFDGLVLLGECRGPIPLGLRSDDAVFGGLGDGRVHVGDVQPLLGGDAPSDETGPTGAILLDEGDFEIEVAGVQGRGVSARPSSDDCDVYQDGPSCL